MYPNHWKNQECWNIEESPQLDLIVLLSSINFIHVQNAIVLKNMNIIQIILEWNFIEKPQVSKSGLQYDLMYRIRKRFKLINHSDD